MSLSRLSILFAALCFTLPAQAALQLFPENGKKLEKGVTEAYDAYKTKDFAKAAKLFLAEAMKGDKNAMFAMGRLYQDGTGVEASIPLAEEYYKKAVTQNHEGARYNLSLIMLSDEKRVVEGLKSLETAATNGHVRAQIDLGQLYLAGKGVTQDFGQAKTWFEKASAQNDGQDGFFLLGQMSEVGQGIAKSITGAVRFYENGASRDQMQCVLRLADIYATGKEEVKADVTKAKKYLQDASAKEENAPTAHFNLGVLLEKIEKKLPEAYQEYAKSAEKGDLQGVLTTANMLMAGTGVTKDAKAAVDWYEKAAKAGAPAGMYPLGLAMEKGEGRDKDAAKGREWILKAALTGNPSAMRDLALRYRQGTGAETGNVKDMVACTTWLQKALQAGDVDSGMILSEMLEKGDEVTRDFKASTALLTQIAQLGVQDAVMKLADNTAAGRGTPQDPIRAYALLLAAGNYEPAKKRRDELAKTMTVEQLADADKEKERIMGQNKQAKSEKDKAKDTKDKNPK